MIRRQTFPRRGPQVKPVGLDLAQTSKIVGRAFDEALTEVGGSMSTWLVLLSAKIHSTSNQRELAETIGIQGATLTHHLNTMEADGLITRRFDPKNRRVNVVELTPKGESLFETLREAAMAFDRRLRKNIAAQEVAAFTDMLARLRDNAGGSVVSSDLQP